MKGDNIMETKICSKCKIEKSISNFRWRNKAKGSLHSQCKDCEKERDKIHYRESKTRREAIFQTASFQKKRNILIVEKAKECGCKKCGEKRSYVLDFHHRNPEEKIANINHLLKSASEEKLLEEIEKCDVLCSNCHREFHYLNVLLDISYEDYINALVAYEVGALV